MVYMDDKRRLYKQIFIAVVYLVIFSGLGTGIYFLVRPAPTPLPPPAPTIYPIQVLWSQAFVVGQDFYSVGAKIRNPNTDFGASYFTYTFYLYDASGALLTTASGESFIWPGESKYVISGGINITKAPVRVEMAVGEPAWREIKEFKGVDLTLGNINFSKPKSSSGIFFVVNATAGNNTSYDLNKVYVAAVIFDKGDRPIAVNSTILDNLKSKERRPVSLTWFLPFLDSINRVDASISTNLWERPELLGQ
ncbi:MAG: hypothetical protein UV62_C0038G0005 [Parcubacteria group bacterium GW2011_GWC1_43_11]|nr:MAG: hypothetical protein UV62_C0038G0005 [Parcubacteria group bacterium GW2011_GWC1_43_11]